MLSILRKKGVMKRLLWIVAGVIIISFGFLSQAYLLKSGNGPQHAGKIFGKNISREKFAHHFSQTRLQAFLLHRRNFEKIADQLNLEAETWDRIILLHEAEKRHIRIPDEDVVQAIQNHPFFLIDGKFNALIYKEVLTSNLRMNPRQFEEGLRESLKIARLYNEETGQVNISEDELMSAYQRDYEKIQVDYLLFEPKNYIDHITDDEEKIREFFLANRQAFTLPPMINLEYMHIAYADTEPAAGEPQIDTPATAEPESDTLATAEPESDTLATADAPAPEEPTADAPATPESVTLATAEPIEDALPTEEPQAEKTAPGTDETIPEEPAEDETKQETITDEQKDAAFDKAFTILTELEDGSDFLKMAEQFKLPVTQTGLFDQQQPLLQSGWSYQQISMLTQLETGEFSEPLEVENGLHIVRVIEKTDERAPSFEEIRSEAVSAWRLNEAKKIAFQKAEETNSLIKNPETPAQLPQVAEQTGLKLHETELFTRGDYLPTIGNAPLFQHMAFQLNKEQNISDVVETPAGYTLMQFKKFVEADQEKFEEVRNTYYDQFMMRQKENRFREYLTSLRLQSNLQDYISEMLAQQKEDQRLAREAAEAEEETAEAQEAENTISE